MSFAMDLLEQAEHLARREKKRPKQASLRRATSTAYYAVFHLLLAECASLLAPRVSPEARAKLQRLANHADIKTVCGRFLQNPVQGPLSALLDVPVSDDLRAVARSFIQLQEARHSADYDLNSVWTKAQALGHVQTARDSFSSWERVARNAEANIFLLAFLTLKQLESVR